MEARVRIHGPLTRYVKLLFAHAPGMPVWRSQTTPVLRLPPELLRMRTVKDIKVNAFVFVYHSHTYPPRLRWEHLSVHRTLFGFIL